MGLFDALGLSGEQKEYYQNESKNLPVEQLRKRQELYKTAQVPNNFWSYSQGHGTADDAMNIQGLSPEQIDAAQTKLATDAITGSRFATEQVQNNPILSKLFGKGGAMERADTEEQDLAKRGYNLQPEDYEAYGQASGNIARMFGTQEQSLAQSLANRGLAAAPSGAAGVEYTGLAGNKMEQLANQQRQIADQRMQMNLQRLNATRNYLSGLGNQAENAINQQYNRQLAGAGEQRSALENASQLTTAQNAEANNAGLASMQNKQSQKGQTLGEAFGAGLKSSATQLGAAPGNLASSYTGGLGSSLTKMGAGLLGGGGGTVAVEPGQSAYERANGITSADWGGGRIK